MYTLASLVCVYIEMAPRVRQVAKSVAPTKKFQNSPLEAALIEIVSMSLPMRTPVDSIPKIYASKFGGALPISVNALVNEYAHLFTFTQNRAGQIFAELKAHTDTHVHTGSAHVHTKGAPTGNVHVHTKGASTGSAPTGIAHTGTHMHTVSTPKTPPQTERADIEIYRKSIEKILHANPTLAEAADISKLFEQMSVAFFEMFHVPMQVSAEEVLRGFRLVKEPVTGSVCVSGRLSTPTQKVAQIAQPSKATVAPKRAAPTPAAHSGIMSGLEKLRVELVKNLQVIDNALGRTEMIVPDIDLWTGAINTLYKQELQANEILTNLFFI